MMMVFFAEQGSQVWTRVRVYISSPAFWHGQSCQLEICTLPLKQVCAAACLVMADRPGANGQKCGAAAPSGVHAPWPWRKPADPHCLQHDPHCLQHDPYCLQQTLIACSRPSLLAADPHCLQQTLIACSRPSLLAA